MALRGIRVIEVCAEPAKSLNVLTIEFLQLAGLAPVPFAGLILADWGADVVRIDRPGSASAVVGDRLTRGKRSAIIDLRSAEGVRLARDLVAQADVLLDPFRPGVLERIGLGPEIFLGPLLDGQAADALNPRLVYARIAGYVLKQWIQVTGPQRLCVKI